MPPKKAKAAPPGGPGSPLAKKAKLGAPDAAVWEWQDGDSWKAFIAVDCEMLENHYQNMGKKVKFTTTNFSFNSKHQSKYELNYSKMTQMNLESKTLRNIRRRDAAGKPKASWEWWTSDCDWAEYKADDSALLEKAFALGVSTFETKELSFNKGYNSLYIFDFDTMSQVNSDSGTSRKIQRTAAGGSKAFGHTKGEDDAYADVLMAGQEADKTAGGAEGMKFDLGLSAKLVAEQKKLGAQSLRKRKKAYGPVVSKDKHGKACFDQMLANEAEFCGEWAVFYHSYSCAAILYEVQAAVASVLFRFKAEFAGLPRILAHGFKKIPDADRMQEEFPKWEDQDHNPAFKAVGLCATSGLLAPDDEAPATGVFLAGYSVGALGGVLEKLLGAVGVPKASVNKLAKDILDLAQKHGLDTSGIPGGKGCKSGRSGHMLQVFLRRELVDKFVYPAFPYGVPDNKRAPLGKYLEKNAAIQGQVRITLNPDAFLRASYSRMFTYSADPTYHNNRSKFIKDLVDRLDPILGEAAVRVKAANGIFGGKPPDWWTAEDQSEMAAMPAARFASSSME